MCFGSVSLEKYKTRLIGDKNPIFIIGMCPGRQRKRHKNFEVFHGNRTGDLIEKIVKDKNVFLTNIINFRVKGRISKEDIEAGRQEFLNDIERLKPQKVICLGNFSYTAVSKWLKSMSRQIDVIKITHPSYILRFNKDIDIYINKLTNLI